MARHLSESALVDALDGIEDGVSRAHLRECPACAACVREMAETLGTASGVDVPEPAGAYWEAFRSQVGHRRDEKASGWRRFFIPGLAAAAAAALAVVLSVPPAAKVSTAPAALLPAWSALPDADADAMAVLGGLGPSEEEVESLEGDRGVAERIADLSDEESRAVAEALQGDWAGRKL